MSLSNSESTPTALELPGRDFGLGTTLLARPTPIAPDEAGWAEADEAEVDVDVDVDAGVDNAGEVEDAEAETHTSAGAGAGTGAGAGDAINGVLAVAALLSDSSAGTEERRKASTSGGKADFRFEDADVASPSVDRAELGVFVIKLTRSSPSFKLLIIACVDRS